MNDMNTDRRRWYGVRPGDTVEQKAFGTTNRGIVIHLDEMDNNAVIAELKDGTVTKFIPEWCTVVVKIEDKIRNGYRY